MKKQIILTTGSSTGFGRRAAEQLAKQGHTVYASMRHSKTANKKFAEDLTDWAKEGSYNLKVIDLDVTSDALVYHAISKVVEAEGGIDVVVNSAGVWGPGVLEAFTTEQWKELFEVNVFGSVRVTKAVLPFMREQGDDLIIQISSLQGRFILPYSGPYVASKFAIEGAMETFRYEVAPFGVDVVIIEPGDFMTEIKGKAVNYAAFLDNVTDQYAGVGEFINNAYLTPDANRSGNPQLVVDAINKLVDTPKGERPIRTTVGNFLDPIEQINKVSEEMHQQLFPYIGLGDLLILKK